MKTKEIQELIDFITKSGLEEVHIETEAIKIHVKRSIPIPGHVASLPPNPFVPPAQIAPEAGANNPNHITIKSPMIGTFYRSPHPEEAPFVKEGDAIVKGTKLCIIEAMKLYNEIESEVTGKIVQILVDDVSPVEYDQPLFIVEPISG
ncbi:MAG: acetyl-CoA carboxylase biotin carboxyl carrier protein [Candidatus Cardinium sp.]|uniref:acetyl-CoA carboxylase biotin carboxyl carrier protein n=1 Tax=Cardinium endosymbiont of Dermatophagoides farinae TaxID=2597823 RepID=UPI0011822C26|nr:acetyl-CoA carboxylase biotin carboxyl carrier protein [Cardinium endosymbiont of Dermatophagoides farinae]TSJ80583.1 acetyl-CoA carboxylase biotin carboxyl carrier protein [Cardinium endosymbiont of Dermatophagoides farinae]UWW96571.1 MAG: acetyl-CoA carboxylase biotin carboxyl carrier protein [Candidatus Cardinium sp.]